MCKERIVNIQTGEVLDWGKVNNLKDNALLKVKPLLFAEWDFEKNSELDFDIYRMTKASAKKVWWICPKCKSSYDMAVHNKKNGKNCPYCRGLKANYTNSLSSLRPDIADQWHPIKNKKTPHEYVLFSHTKVWWLGDCGHEWEAMIKDRCKENGTNCPICSNNELLLGFNDMWTTNPELASLLLNPEDGFKFQQSSGKKLDWKCSRCGNIIKNKSPNNTVKQGLSCAICDDNVSYAEKIIYGILLNSDINFVFNKGFSWSNNKRYDFYLIDYDCIIEAHGIQHYIETNFSIRNNKTIEDEMKNDKYKRELALKNKIKKYIEIDCRKSELEFIKHNIVNSELFDLLNGNLNFNTDNIKVNSSLKIEAWDLWNTGEYLIKDISEKLKVDRTTITRYLKIGNDLGKCNYVVSKKYRPPTSVVKLSLDGEFMKVYKTISHANDDLNTKNHIGLVNACDKKGGIFKGFKWMYYEEFLEQQNNAMNL